jgi:hypothetical protein
VARKVESKRSPPEYILANHYLSIVYGLFGELGWRAINVSYNGIVHAMKAFSCGLDLNYEPPGTSKDRTKEIRVAMYLKYLLYARGRQRSDRHDVHFKCVATEFVEKHKALFAEIFFVETNEKARVPRP